MSIDREICEKLGDLAGRRAVILGIGNSLKGDDGVGPSVCERLSGQVCADVIDAGTVPENYVGKVVSKKPQELLVIDAMDLGSTAGRIKLIKPEKLSSVATSTHTLSPRLFVDLIREQIDVNVMFLGIQPKQVDLGEGMSEEVSEAAESVCRVLADVFPAIS